MIYESIKMVFKVFKTNKLRTFLTMLGIIIGIFSITIIFTISSATQSSLKSQLSFLDEESVINVSIIGTYDEESESALINIPESEILALEDDENIKSVSAIVSYQYEEMDKLQEQETMSDLSWMSYTCTAIGYNAFDYYENGLGMTIVEGRTFTKKDDVNNMPFCIISTSIANKVLGKSEGIVGETITINDTDFQVIGVYSSKQSYYEGWAFVLYSYAKNQFDEMSSLRYRIVATSPDVKEDVRETVNNKLLEYLNSNEYSIEQDDTSYEDELNSIFGVIELVFGGIAGLSLLVGGIGIMNIMLVSVNERIKEIGIRMALGANSGNIKLQFLIEGVMLTILSGILGMLLAALVVFGANKFIASSDLFENADFKLVINFGTTVKTIIFCGIIGVIFTIYPANKASKLNPVDALRYE